MTYHVNGRGQCMGSGMGERMLEVDPTAPIAPRDVCFAAISGEGDSPWGDLIQKHTDQGYVGVIKIYLGRIGDVILLAQLVPPVIAPVQVGDVVALHRVNLPLLVSTAKDRAALELMRSFMGEAHAPIGQGWRPQMQEAA